MRKCKNWIEKYLEYTDPSEAPEAFHVWTAISTIGAVLQRKVWIDQRIFQWTPNFYIVFVGPPGVVTKSTSVKLGTDLLQNVEGVTFGPNSLTWNALTVALEDAQISLPLKPGDFDSELIEMACVTCSIGELGTFLDPNDRKMVDVFTDLWDGQKGQWKHATKTTGTTTINNPWLNIIGATTPSWLRENFPESMIGGGLTSRIVFVYGNKKRKLVAYPFRQQNQDVYNKMREDLIHDLNEMNKMLGPYTMTDQAVEWGEEWYKEHWENPSKDLSNERFEGYIARKQTHLHKLAIVVAASQRDELRITSGDLKTANSMVTLLERDMMKVFRSIGVTQESKNLYTIIKILLLHARKLQQNNLFTYVASNMTVKDFNEALDSGIKMGYLQQVQEGRTIMTRLINVPDDLLSSNAKKEEET